MSLLKNLAKSVLGLKGKTPSKYSNTVNDVANTKKALDKSILDLNGKTPSKYLDNPPK